MLINILNDITYFYNKLQFHYIQYSIIIITNLRFLYLYPIYVHKTYFSTKIVKNHIIMYNFFVISILTPTIIYNELSDNEK